MLLFDRDVLRHHGFEMDQTDNGFRIYATKPLPDDARDALRAASAILGLEAADEDKLTETAVELSCWRSLRSASNEAVAAERAAPKKSKSRKGL